MRNVMENARLPGVPAARAGGDRRVRVAPDTRDPDEQYEAERRLREKFANFKSAVQVGKGRIEDTSTLRQERYSEFVKHAAVTAADEAKEEAAGKFLEREILGLRAGRRIWTTDDFKPICTLGSGAFGTVHLVQQKGTENYFALKQMRKARYQKKNYRERAFAERDILSKAQTYWFVELFATFQDSDHVFMLMEFVQGGELFKHLEIKIRFTPEETAFYMAELLEALDVVHQHGFVHRDVKPDNVILTAEGHIKLLDFGLCKHDPSVLEEEQPVRGSTRRARLQSRVGTPQYMAPESFQGEARAAGDLWALGVVTFECLYGGVPFHAGNKEGLEAIPVISKQVQEHATYFPKRLQKAKTFGFMPPKAEALLRKLICPEADRLNAEQIRQDPFFEDIDFRRLHSMEPPIKPAVEGPADAQNFDDARGATKALPRVKKGTPKDRSLEWAHYEFDRKTRELERPDFVQELFPATSSSRNSSPRGAASTTSFGSTVGASAPSALRL